MPVGIDARRITKRESDRRLEPRPIPLRIDRGKVEQAILEHRPAALDADVARLRLGHVDRFDPARVRRQHGRERALHAGRLRVSEHRASQLVRTTLGDDADDTACRLAVLSFVACRLDLDFLDEVERHAGSERAEHDRVGAEGAVSGIGDIDTVDDVLIFKAAGAAHGRIGSAGTAAAADAGREIQRVAEAPLDGHAGEHLAVDVRSDRRTGYIHDR